MSLTIGIIQERDRRYIEQFNWDIVPKINLVLQKHGLDNYAERPDLCNSSTDIPSMSCRYRDIHYLRYLAAKFIENENWIPDLSYQIRF